MVKSESTPIVTRGAPLEAHSRLDGSSTMKSFLLPFIAAASLGLAIIAIASLQNMTEGEGEGEGVEVGEGSDGG